VTDGTPTVLAGGGLIWRPSSLSVEVAVVHRVKQGDWSWPKGKLEPGETPEQAALREVEEETGLRCRLGRALGTVDYVDGKGRPKRVWYWEMEAPAGEFVANSEVDDLRWVPMAEAALVLDYDTDRIVLDRLVTLLGT
jgi:8-oxo-dGTP pyrophosphatase MutT (NUDIX family)